LSLSPLAAKKAGTSRKNNSRFQNIKKGKIALPGRLEN
jgi:hypothetical protein